MFGELVGIWLADLWQRAGQARGARYVELGPGRGTLAEDALRAMRGAGLAPPVELVETSPVLRRAQAERVFAAGTTSFRRFRVTGRCSSSPTNSSMRCPSNSSMREAKN